MSYIKFEINDSDSVSNVKYYISWHLTIKHLQSFLWPVSPSHFTIEESSIRIVKVRAGENVRKIVFLSKLSKVLGKCTSLWVWAHLCRVYQHYNFNPCAIRTQPRIIHSLYNLGLFSASGCSCSLYETI